MIRKILLPLDVARDGDGPIPYGSQVANALGAELRLLYVTGGDRRADLPPQELDSNAPRALTVMPGKPAETIARYADRIDADLILMPTSGRGWFSRNLFGSTTMDVLRITNRPLWVAKPQSLKAVRFKRILCGVELGTRGQSVLSHAAGLAKAWDAELLLVHASPEISESMLITYGIDDPGDIELLPERARRRISAMAAGIGVPFQVEIQAGSAASIIRKFAKSWRADLVVVGRGRKTERRQLGANVEEIIERSQCPVISFASVPKKGNQTYGHTIVNDPVARLQYANTS